MLGNGLSFDRKAVLAAAFLSALLFFSSPAALLVATNPALAASQTMLCTINTVRALDVTMS
jgi:hypothetical protein